MTDPILLRIVLAVIVGLLFGVIFVMRVMVLMERRVARIEIHIERMVSTVLKEERVMFKSLGKSTGKKAKKRRR